MSGLVLQYMGFAFVLILVFLIVTNADAFKRVLTSLSSANTAAIVAFQGGNPSRFTN